MTAYSKTSHTVFYHRFHIVWITKYRKRVLSGNLRLRIRDIVAQVSDEMGVRILNGVLSADHVHIFAEIPPHISVSEFVKIAKGRTSRKIQQEFPELRKEHWGRHFWGRVILALQVVTSLMTLLTAILTNTRMHISLRI